MKMNDLMIEDIAAEISINLNMVFTDELIFLVNRYCHATSDECERLWKMRNTKSLEDRIRHRIFMLRVEREVCLHFLMMKEDIGANHLYLKMEHYDDIIANYKKRLNPIPTYGKKSKS